MSNYIVIDVEFDGPLPGIHSMISLGAVAINKNGYQLGEFEINLKPLENSNPDPVTMDWFNTEAPDALEYCRQNPFSPGEAMTRFGDWLLSLPSPRIMAAHPSPLDFAWVNWYILKFLRNSLAHLLKTIVSDFDLFLLIKIRERFLYLIKYLK